MLQRIELASELRGRVDVGFVTMREDEARSILTRIPVDREARGRRTYDLATLRDINGAPLQVAHIRCRDQGSDEAEQTTRALIDDLAPRWIVVLGIAGTVPNEDLCLGDVAVSSYVYDIRLSMNAVGGRREYALRPRHLHPAAKDLVARLPSTESRWGPWNSVEMIGQARPEVLLDPAKLVGDADWKVKVAEVLNFHFGSLPGRPNLPVVHTVAFVSGSELTKDPQTVQTWLHGARDAKAIEMELAGAIRACELSYDGNDVPVFSVRGISDVVGLKRDPVWTQFACDSSASFAIAWIKSGAFHATPGWLDRGSEAPALLTDAYPTRVSGRPSATESDQDPLDLLRLGNAAITPKLVIPKAIEPAELYLNLATIASRKGKRRIVVGWNVRPVQHLGIIQFAYLQQLSRLAKWGFKTKINVYDVCTTESYSPVELNALLGSFKRQLIRFRHIQPTCINLVSSLIKKRKAVDLTQELFRLARPSLGQVNNSANDPATSLDNLLCMAVERWEGVDVLLAGGRDANDFWAQYRSRMHAQDGPGTGLSLVLDFPKLEFGSSSAPERLAVIPHCADTIDEIASKLNGLDARQMEVIWNALLAPCNIFRRPAIWEVDRMAQDIHLCFRRSPFLTEWTK